MQRITLDNFRVFGLDAAFDLAPLTVLTGKNNAGKSSLIKAFLVLADYLEQEDQTVLRLDGRRAIKHKITTFKSMRNWNADSNASVGFRYSNAGLELEFEFDEHEDDTLASLVSFQAIISNSEGKLTLTRLERGQLLDSPNSEIEDVIIADDRYQDRGPSYKLIVNQSFIDYFTTQGLERTPETSNDELTKRREEVKLELAEVSQQLVNIEKQKLQPLGEKLQYQLLITKRQDLTRRLEQVEQLWAAFNASKKKTTPLIESEVTSGERGFGGFTITSLIMQGIFTFEDRNREQQKSPKADISARQNLFRFQQSFQRLIRFAPFHVGANRTYQAPLIFNQHQGSELATIVAPFLEKGLIRRGRAENFLSHWLSEFEIGDSVEVRKVEGVAFKVLVTQQRREINLVELGYGAGQILTILLQIAAILQQQEARRFTHRNPVYGPILVLIEEPESNLHPRLQSKLAELFMEPEPYLAAKRTVVEQRRTRLNQALPFQFIIETHSEYLIRKLQLLVANGSHNPAKALIHYMDQPGARRITILADGKLSEEFGAGFFDEADDNAMELFRLQKKAARAQNTATQL